MKYADPLRPALFLTKMGFQTEADLVLSLIFRIFDDISLSGTLTISKHNFGPD